MEPLQEQLDAIIMEFKVRNPGKKDSLERTAENCTAADRRKEL
ncbi:MAG: hypothetical protein U0N03_13090 [Lachnospiraceae bacterium]